jgi:hypothetical protein
MRQTWANIIWCHWPVPAHELQALLPAGLSPDLFEGQAWIGLVPFSMVDLRIPGPLGFLTRLSRSANFGEVNVRTYVVGPDGRRGVWFFTLDADSVVGVATANLLFGLPYRVSKTSLTKTTNTRRWTSERRRDRARSILEVEVGNEPARPAAPGLESFLFERYALYSLWHGLILRGELSHDSWRIKPAELRTVVTDIVLRAGFTVSGEPHLFVGDPVEVSVHPMRIARRR